MNTVSVIIPTFGDKVKWDKIAGRAVASIKSQVVQPNELLRIHAETLQDARNEGGSVAKSRFLVFLDADDELEPHYIEAMLSGTGDVRYPNIEYIEPEGDRILATPKPKNLYDGNYIVIGAMVRRDQFLAIDGFYDEPVFEDWSLFLRLWLAGADIQPCPGAIYRNYLNPRGRNHPSVEVMEAWQAKIRGYGKDSARLPSIFP